MINPTVAVIGGSGFYELDGLTEIEETVVETPFGAPSSPIVSGNLAGTRMLFLTRHGRGHRLLPTEVNYRANIFALKKLGATKVISVSAVGSMREDIHPGEIVVVDQYIDRTKGRPSTFFGGGIVGHVMFADPVCAALRRGLFKAACDLKIKAHDGGTLMVMEGPAFSTRAESKMHRGMGVDLIGMTAMPEAKLAREAELCYCTLALATDYDCWHESEEDVSVEAVLDIMDKNIDSAKRIVELYAREEAGASTDCGCATALEYAVMTDRAVIPNDKVLEMKPVFGRVL